MLSVMGLWTLWDNNKLKPIRIAVEDERLALSNRFKEEGLDLHLNDGQKLPHVWRWLVDAETNCQSLRHQIDKMHRQHEQDLKEVEEYLEHVWKLSNDRLLQLEEENKSLKKTLNQKESSFDLKREKAVNNLCDSLKLKSGFKQIFQNAKGDDNSGENETLNFCENKSRRNSVTINNKHTEQVRGLQDMCQHFQITIKELENEIKILEKSLTNLEIENETLSYKLSESQSQSDQLEHQLIKLNKRQTSSSNKEMKSKIEEANDESLHFLLTSRISNAQNDVILVKQLQDLKNEKHILESELQKRNKEFDELIDKYDKRKTRHRERILRLRNHIERENKQLQDLLKSIEIKYKLAEEELLSHKNYCVINDRN